MIKALAQFAKLLGFVMLFAFLFQTFVAQAEHLGAIACASESGETSPENGAQNPQSCDDCCSHPVAVILIQDSLSWISLPSSAFINLDESLPDGPHMAIDQPPRLA